VNSFGKIKTGSIFIDTDKDVIWVKTSKTSAITLKDKSFGSTNFALSEPVVQLDHNILGDYLLTKIHLFTD